MTHEELRRMQIHAAERLEELAEKLRSGRAMVSQIEAESHVDHHAMGPEGYIEAAHTGHYTLRIHYQQHTGKDD